MKPGLIIVLGRQLEDHVELDNAAVEPFRAIDDPLEWTGKVVPKPWGAEQELVRVGLISIWRLAMEAGSQTSMHCHPNKHTVLTLAEGDACIETLTARYELKPGDVVYVSEGVFHRTSTVRGAVVIEQESPPCKRDLVRLADRYGRAGKGYEHALV